MARNATIDDGVHLRTAILCDQVRTEDNGKRLLIGVYDGGITVEMLPSPYSGSLYGLFEINRNNINSIEYRVTAPGFEGLGEIEMLVPETADQFAVFIAPFAFVINGPGTLALDWRVKGRQWSKSLIWKIEVAENVRRRSAEETEQANALLSAMMG